MLISLLRIRLRPYRTLLVGVLVLQVVQVMSSLYLPNLNADIIDIGVAQGDTGYIWRTGGLMLGVSVLQGICTVAATWLAARSALGMGRDLRALIFRRVGGFSEREVSSFGAGSLITRATNDVQQIQMLVLMSCTMLVTAPLLAVGGVVMAVTHAPSLSWLIGAAVPVLIVVVGLTVRRMVPLFRAFQERLDSINRVLREQLTGIRVVRAFVREEAETERFETANRDISRVGERVGRLFVFLFPAAMLVLDVTMVGVIWFGGHQVGAGDVEVGTLVAFMTYLMQILMGIVMASFMMMMIPRAAVCAERISEVLATDPALVVDADATPDFPEPGAVEMRDVSFTYPGAEEPVLEGITFTARPGQTVAVVGSTGSGKTTLINLIPRLLDVSDGQVLVGGTDVRRAEPEALWSQLGLVPQKPFLFAGTVASNLRLGREEATDDELWEALELAQARDFVTEMDGGLQAPIAQGGTNVSGGQRQRLAIARAIVRRPAVLVFDDSFSALDVATDADLRAALWPATVGVTKIVVAQRVSTITEADLILVLDEGRLTASGAHETLLADSETYREIVISQFGNEVAA
ncbi:ABC transporter ATP-binding protein [Actinomyces gerencseriae]|uniref:ABC transporter ATP-binding protein n=1 Tax=Actinomyces gerencseriae TaxID=52769 RepID=UPI0023F20185|nr:ABC transporter ATP-binding protein [Actinomyces gerencseriae]